MTRRARWRVGLAVVVIVASAPAWAGTVYRWTDAQGVVHFADVPPPNAGTYTTQHLPDEPPAVAPTTSAELGSATPAAGVQRGKGPARVVISDRQENATGDAAQTFVGKVTNEGGAEAHEVAVEIRVIEPTQGDECLRDEIAVEPSTLAPGASGTFERDFENPCFRAPTQTEMRVRWE